MSSFRQARRSSLVRENRTLTSLAVSIPPMPLHIDVNHKQYYILDIIECMANSDNVIRAGLTPKLRDIPNLVKTLTYAAAPASRHVVKPLPFSASLASTLYDPPITEFSVVNTILTPGQSEGHREIDGPSIALIASGKGKLQWPNGTLDVVRGEAIFVGANTAIDFFAAGDEGEKLEIYRAFVEV